ncbi:MAG: hypothetical protein WBL27_06745 [Salinimicrobium sp.]
MKMEDQPDPCQSSSFYRRHFEFFNIEPEAKTIKSLVIELKARVRESFFRRCHYQPQTYDFKDFRLTRTYRLHRELLAYLSKLSSWLYRGGTIPPSLKKAFSKGHTFVNPYEGFDLEEISEEKIPLLNNLMLCVAYNLNICSRFTDPQLRKHISNELRNRNMDVSEIEKNKDVLIELVKSGQKEQVVLLQETTE